MSIVYTALAQIYTHGSTVHLEDGVELYKQIGKGSVGFLSISFIIFLVLLVLLYIFQRKTYLGRSISLTGGNSTAARLSGIPVKGSIITVYTISGLMTAVGAIVLFSRVTSASPSTGTGYDVNALMAVVIGGTSLSGGKGGVLRTVLGVVLVTLMANCLNMLGVSSFTQNILEGLIMIFAIWLDNRKER
jgi:ribose transport system permease protein